jgi:hypothetical protein
MRSSINGRTLPDSMINPPDLCPPPDVPVAILTSIDIQLEYQLCGESTPQAQGFSFFDLDTLGQELSIPCEQRLRLLEIGIQRLFISSSIKDPTIRVSKQASTKSLTDMFPAVFSPRYRDVSSNPSNTSYGLTPQPSHR